MDKSEQLNELFAALSKAQAQIKGTPKDAQNPFFKSSYSTLDQCWESARGPLSANGLSVVQIVQEAEGKMFLVTILGHSSGQFITSKMPMVLPKPDPQTLGSVTSYCRRYSLCAMVGLSSSDDDGEQATQPYRAESVQTKQLSADEFCSLLKQKLSGKPAFSTSDMRDYLDKLASDRKLSVMAVMEQALSYAERFFKSYQDWYAAETAPFVKS